MNIPGLLGTPQAATNNLGTPNYGQVLLPQNHQQMAGGRYNQLAMALGMGNAMTPQQWQSGQAPNIMPVQPPVQAPQPGTSAGQSEFPQGFDPVWYVQNNPDILAGYNSQKDKGEGMDWYGRFHWKNFGSKENRMYSPQQLSSDAFKQAIAEWARQNNFNLGV